jgi:hypothetical protein
MLEFVLRAASREYNWPALRAAFSINFLVQGSNERAIFHTWHMMYIIRGLMLARKDICKALPVRSPSMLLF